MPTLNKWGERAVNIVAIGAMLTLFVNIADSRYAIADDLKKLKADLHARDVLEVEDKIAIFLLENISKEFKLIKLDYQNDQIIISTS